VEGATSHSWFFVFPDEPGGRFGIRRNSSESRGPPPCSQLSEVPGVGDVGKGEHLDVFGERIGRFPGIDDPQPLQFKVFNCHVHGSGQSGGVFILEFHPPVLPTRLPEKIKFRAGVGVPEIEIPILLSQGSANEKKGDRQIML